jgi:porin
MVTSSQHGHHDRSHADTIGASRIPRFACFATAFAILLTASESVMAQVRAPDEIFAEAERLEETRVDTHLGPSCIDRAFAPFKCMDTKLEEMGGPQLVGLYAPIWQGGTQRGHDNMISQSLNIYGEWELLRKPGNEGTLYLFYLHESESTGTTAGQFADGIGTTILPNDDVGDAVHALGHLAWSQHFFDSRLQVSVGQLALKIYIDQNDYAGWDRTAFMSQPLAGNSVRNFPIAALGVDTMFRVTDNLEFSLTAADADGRPFYPDFHSFGRRWVYVPGIVFKTDLPCLGKGRYEVNFSHTERTERFNPGRSSSVWLFSFNQEITPTLATFLRFGTGDGRRTTVQQSLATGIVFTQAFGYNNDWLGLGFIWTDPSDGTRRDDYGMEMFWRLQLTEDIQVTPDVQLYFDPSRNPNRDLEVAFGLRMGIFF